MDTDFFSPVVPEDRYHPNFRMMIEQGDPFTRETFNRWAEGFVDRDGKIVVEFQTTFNSAFWEVYLHRLFIELGFTIDYSYNNPDFVLSKNDMSLCVEAVTSNHAQNMTPEWDLDAKLVSEKQDLTKLNFSAMLRHLNSIHAKHKKYLDLYSSLDHVKGKPYIIALGAYDQPHFWLEFDRAIRAVLYDYYVDEQNDVDAPTIETQGTTPAKKIGYIKNKNGSNVGLGIFCDNRMKEVSAIIFNCVATHSKLRALSDSNDNLTIFIGVRLDKDKILQRFSVVKKDYDEAIQDGLQVFHNPYALYPLPIELFRKPGIIQHYYSRIYDSYICEGEDKFLVFRLARTIRPVKNFSGLTL